jgi:hypothetical protein
MLTFFDGCVDIERELLERCDALTLGRISTSCSRLREEATKVARAVRCGSPFAVQQTERA